MAAVIDLSHVRRAKAQGVFAAVNMTARELGYSDVKALRAAQRARDAYRRTGGKAERVVSAACADLAGECGGRLA